MYRYVVNTQYDARRLRRRPRPIPLLPSDTNTSILPQPTAPNTRKLPQKYRLRLSNHIRTIYLDSDAISNFQKALDVIWEMGRSADLSGDSACIRYV